MASQYRIERDRGTKESPKQLAVLREKWPLAFPAKPQDVRPLASGVAGEIGTTMGWSHPYVIGVLSRWKMARVYCQVVLSHDQRITLDGAPAEPVDAEAKDMAAKRLATLAAAQGCEGSEIHEIGEENRGGRSGRREASPFPVSADRDGAGDAGAIAKPGACLTLAAERYLVLWIVMPCEGSERLASSKLAVAS